jgi:hypothetical protein
MSPSKTTTPFATVEEAIEEIRRRAAGSAWL